MSVEQRQVIVTLSELETIFSEWKRITKRKPVVNSNSSDYSEVCAEYFIELHDNCFANSKPREYESSHHRNSKITDLVKIECIATTCANNMIHHSDFFGCNLKVIQIDETGQCPNYHKINHDEKL